MPFDLDALRKHDRTGAIAALEIDRLRLWVRRIENINDDPSCFNAEIDAACRAAFHGLPMNGKINVQLPAPPEKE